MNAQELLSIRRPSKLFTPNIKEARKEFLELMKEWHPDVSKDDKALDVARHVSDLYEQAQQSLIDDHWGYAGKQIVENGIKKFWVRYHKKFEFEIGQGLIGDECVFYLIGHQHLERVEQFVKGVNLWKLKPEHVRNECIRYLPGNWKAYGTTCIRVDKDHSDIRLRDVLNFYGVIQPESVAWIISSLLNLCCFFEYSGLTHNDISLDTYFINPESHSGRLLGGWWWAVKQGDRLQQVPTRTFKHLPFKVRTTKIASRSTDAALVKAVGREILGDEAGKNYKVKVPAPMAKWLMEPPRGSATDRYSEWDRVLEASFGPRQFVPMDIVPEMLF